MAYSFLLVTEHHFSERLCFFIVAKGSMGLFETEDTIDDRLQTVRGNCAHFDEVSTIASENNSDRRSSTCPANSPPNSPAVAAMSHSETLSRLTIGDRRSENL